MGDWEKFNKTSLPEKEDFYINQNMKDIADADYKHAKRICEKFKIIKLGKYHDLYVHSEKLLSVNVFEKILNMCLKVYMLEPTRFFPATELA